MKTMDVQLRHLSKPCLLGLWTLSCSMSWIGALSGAELEQKITAQNGKLEPRSLFECLPKEDTVEHKLSASDRRIGMDIICALSRGTFDGKGAPLNINPKNLRPRVPKTIILNCIFPYFAREKFRLYRTIELPHIQEMYPSACKITDDGHIITLDKRGNWQRHNIKTGACDLRTVIPNIDVGKVDLDYACISHHFNISHIGESLVCASRVKWLDQSNLQYEYFLTSIDKVGNPLGLKRIISKSKGRMGNNDLVSFLPDQHVLLTDVRCRKIIKYNMNGMQEIATYKADQNHLLAGFTAVDSQHIAALMLTNSAPPSIHIIKTDNMQTINTIKLHEYYMSNEPGNIRSLGSEKFFVTKSRVFENEKDYYIIDMHQKPVHCNDQNFEIAYLPFKKLGNPISKMACSNDRYAIVDKGDVMVGNTRKETFRKVFSNIVSRDSNADFPCRTYSHEHHELDIDFSKDHMAIHNKLRNKVTILQPVMTPDVDYTHTLNNIAQEARPCLDTLLEQRGTPLSKKDEACIIC